MPNERVYPDAGNVATWYANLSNAVSSASEVTVGQHVGASAPGGVTADVSVWADYTPIHRVDNPSDGINDSADYVVYFVKKGTDPVEYYKATDADIGTLAQLSSGSEYDGILQYTPGGAPA